MSRLTRKSGLSRGKPLERGGGLKRGPGPKRKRPEPATAEEVEAMARFHALATAKGARCAVCGHRRRADLEVHHVVGQQELKRRGLHALLWEPDNGLVLCDEPAPARCHTRHELAVRRVPRARLRPENLKFAEGLGLSHYIESHYPGEGS